jgi:hypothetical protein
MTHVHTWGSWSGWSYAGHDTDMRTQPCTDGSCGYANADYRTHVHSYTGGPDSICRDCGTPR